MLINSSKNRKKIAIKRSIDFGRLNWDTASQPVNDLFEPEIQPNFGHFSEI